MQEIQKKIQTYMVSILKDIIPTVRTYDNLISSANHKLRVNFYRFKLLM